MYLLSIYMHGIDKLSFRIHYYCHKMFSSKKHIRNYSFYCRFFLKDTKVFWIPLQLLLLCMFHNIKHFLVWGSFKLIPVIAMDLTDTDTHLKFESYSGCRTVNKGAHISQILISYMVACVIMYGVMVYYK